MYEVKGENGEISYRLNRYPTSRYGAPVRYDRNNYPLLSEFISDLQKILEINGDGPVSIDNEWTDELASVDLRIINGIKYFYLTT